jgi:hypothetical protein
MLQKNQMSNGVHASKLWIYLFIKNNCKIHNMIMIIPISGYYHRRQSLSRQSGVQSDCHRQSLAHMLSGSEVSQSGSSNLPSLPSSPSLGPSDSDSSPTSSGPHAGVPFS